MPTAGSAPEVAGSPPRDEARWLELLKCAGCLIPIAVGLVVALGWIFDLPVVRNLVPGLPAMKFNTALALVAAGVGVRLLQAEPRRPPGGIAVAGAGALVLAIGLGALIERGFDVDLGVDNAIVVDGLTAPEQRPGLMSVATALALTLIGLALLARRFRRGAAGDWLALRATASCRPGTPVRHTPSATPPTKPSAARSRC
jgi:hypothetical protein